MSVDDDLSKLLSSTSLIFVGVLLSSVSRLIERVIIGQEFSLEVFGEVSIGLTILSLGSSITLVGLNHGVPRYISRFDDEQDVRGVWVTGAIIAFCASSVVAGILYVNVELLTETLFEQANSEVLVKLFILAMPLTSLTTIGISAIRGLENTRYKILANDLFRPGARLLLLVGFIALGFGAESAGYAYLLGSFAAVVVTYYLFNRLSDIVGPFRTHGRTLVAFGAPLVVSMLLATLLTRMDTLMLASLRSSAQVGLYTAAYPLAQTLLLVVSCFGYLYLPLTSRLDANGKHDELTSVYRMTTKWSYVLTFPVFLVFFLFPGDVLTMFFGREFADGGVALAVLSIGFFASAALGRNRETLSALGDTKKILAADVTALGLNFVMNLALIPAYGFLGASVASAISFVVRNIAINAFLWSEYDITPFSRKTVQVYVLLPTILLPLAAATSATVSLSLVTLPLALVVAAFFVVLIVSLSGSLQAEDLVAVEFLEDLIGVEIPYLRRYVQTPE